MVQESTEKPSTSSATTPSQEDLDALAEVLSAGKRHLICNEPDRALELFVELCERLSSFYGEKSDECAEAYLYYGKTLLELARLENGVLGNAVKEVPEEDDEDETKKEDKNDEDADKDKPLADEKQSSMVEKGTSPEEESKSASSNEPTNAKASTETPDTPEDNIAVDDDGEDDGGEDDADDTQDVTNMELSWEMLELTCEICNRMVSEKGKNLKKAKRLLAEAKYGLAQISMEEEQYELAITDFKSCLDIHKEVLEDKLDRRMAEVHYNIGLAYSFDKKFEEAILSFKGAVTLLESRKEMLRKKVEGTAETSGKGKATSELNDWNKEIKELEELILLEMNAKIEDAEEMKRQADEAIKTMKEKAKDVFGSLATVTTSGFEDGFDAGFDAPASSDDQEVVHDISHKIRSTKRSSDDDGSSVEAKKMKTTTNGAAETSGVTNGKINGQVENEQKPTSIGG